MGIRQRLNEHPLAAGIATCVLIAAALGAGYTEWMRGGRESPVGKRYFTIDDGQTWFPGDATKIPPFEHHGKIAYGIRVYRCPKGIEFASHMERYSEAAKKRLRETVESADRNGGAVAVGGMSAVGRVEVKRPGDKEWVTLTANTKERYAAIVQPKCPNGDTAGLQEVIAE